MLDPFGVEGRHASLGCLEVFAGVDVEEREVTAQVLEGFLRDRSHPDSREQLLHRFLSGHQEAFNRGDASFGVDGAEGFVDTADDRKGQVVARRGLENPFQNLTGQKRKVHAQNEASLETGVPQPGQDATQRPCLPNFVGSHGDMERGEDLRGAYDEDVLNVGLEEIDGPVDQAPTGQREESLIASHPLAAAAGKDETAEPSAGLHRTRLQFVTKVMLAAMIPHLPNVWDACRAFPLPGRVELDPRERVR